MKAVAWMAGALVFFSLIGVGARELTGEIPVFETLFFRSLTGILLVLSVVAARGKFTQLHTRRLRLHFTRNLFHFAGQYTWFLAIGLLPLAEVFALEFTVPVWTLIIAAVVLKEAVTGRKLISIALGLSGVLVIVRPGIDVVDPASLLALGAALCYAICHSATKVMALSESPFAVLFYMCLIQIPLGFFLALPRWVWPEGQQWGWLLLLGFSAMAGHYCMASAMAHAEVTKVVTFDFLRLPLIAVVGVIFYAEPFDLFILLGGGLMLLGNLISANRKIGRTAPG